MTRNHNHLNRIIVRGFKSIANCDLKLGPLNVLIGSNGAGKSNFIGFFKFLQQLFQRRLQHAVGKAGGPDAILHFGRKKTKSLDSTLYFWEDRQNPEGFLSFTLEPTDDNCMMFSEEKFGWRDHDTIITSKDSDPGKLETQINPPLLQMGIYHFHDTSDTALVKQPRGINDNSYLRSDASNLAAYLYFLKNNYRIDYDNIEKTIHLVAPFFGKFALRPNTYNAEQIELEWFEEGEDVPFKANNLSDGTLRFICLVTLLLQPKEKQPDIIIIDEPELGLHPYAITILAALIKSLAKDKQIIIATQSVDLLSEFSPEDIIVVDRDGNKSVLSRLDVSKLSSWLEEYSLGELWKKNILGGRPSS